eukprot:6184828-Pleurochrysis_carterae.AAC.5
MEAVSDVEQVQRPGSQGVPRVGHRATYSPVPGCCTAEASASASGDAGLRERKACRLGARESLPDMPGERHCAKPQVFTATMRNTQRDEGETDV